MKSTIFFTLAIAALVNAAPFNRNGTTLRRRDLPARSGPVYSVYADVGTTAETWPSAENLGDWNDFLMSFWVSDGNEPRDVAAVWASMDPTLRQTILDQYHAAGKTLRVAVFGQFDLPLQRSPPGDPVEIASAIVDFVKQFNLDGVDVDYEDTDSFSGAKAGTGEDFVIQLTKSLRELLPSGQFLISHAPQSPYFIPNSSIFTEGAYLKINQEVGDSIDFYNIQFYNQGIGAYETCEEHFTAAPSNFPGTTVNDLIDSGIPQEKIILGKPGLVSNPADATVDDAINGFVDPVTLGQCITSQSTKPGGVMAFQFRNANAAWIAEAKGDLP